MIQRFKGITTTLDAWNASTKIVRDELWCVVQFPDNKIGLKIGNGTDVFTDLPWIINPDQLNTFIIKPDIEEPSATKFLNQLGEYVEIESGSDDGCNLDVCITEMEDRGLELLTTEEAEWVRTQMFVSPKFTSFSSISNLIGKVPMGTALTGTLNFKWDVSTPENAGLGQVTVDDGLWEGGTDIDLSDTNSANITLLSSNISSNVIKTITFTLSGVDIKGNQLSQKTLTIVWTHNIYWGTSSTKSISTLNELTNRNEISSNSINRTIEFTPVGQQYSILLIPNELEQDNVNIVNKNASSIDHSYNMNEGDGGTKSLYSLDINGILYNAYVTYATTGSTSTAIIK